MNLKYVYMTLRDGVVTAYYADGDSLITGSGDTEDSALDDLYDSWKEAYSDVTLFYRMNHSDRVQADE